ncbi:hypothetical protein PVAP13_8KG343202 [Panicum virgatum]|uniref:Uncharacterized protein n=1 Tax=Panicum virgatum TaxID=38727 RepID=A0A8T0PSV5_PANVG|nr:hypothetical protein PVAP13_8KG343202 [Panicum virgatum]
MCSARGWWSRPRIPSQQGRHGQLVGSAQTPRAAFDRPSARGRLRRRATAVPARAAVGRWRQRRYACRSASQGRLAPPAATTGLSSPSRRPARRVTMEEKKGGEGADTEEPATGLPHHPSSRLASRPAPPRRRKPGPTHPALPTPPWPCSASRARQACCRAACVERQGERVHRGDSERVLRGRDMK